VTGRTFDYVPRLDERNRTHRMIAADLDLDRKSRYWVPGAVLDQGQEGACVGFGCTAEAIASPVRRKDAGMGTYASVGNRVARGWYHRAKEIDEWEGVDYEGTSVRAGMLAGREGGFWEGFRWAFNMVELRAALEEGPVVIGVEWRSAMYEAPNGLLSANGVIAGGHCILVTGYSPDWRGAGPFFRLRNSWGTGWGINGSAYISQRDLDEILFQAGGEAAVSIGRKL
jgi:hypothetical protein